MAKRLQVALAPGERTAARLSGEGEVLLYVLEGAIRLESPVVDTALTKGDSVKMRHCDLATWRSEDVTPSLVLVGIGPSAQLVDVMISASVSD